MEKRQAGRVAETQPCPTLLTPCNATGNLFSPKEDRPGLRLVVPLAGLFQWDVLFPGPGFGQASKADSCRGSPTPKATPRGEKWQDGDPVVPVGRKTASSRWGV